MAAHGETAFEARASAAFDDRYGEGAYRRLHEWLARPCVTFAAIARRLGVSRERVRQWHRQFLPDAPTGRERRQRCLLHQRRRHVFSDQLFRAFFQQARAQIGPGRIQPLPSRTGYRRDHVLIDGRLVALRDISDDGRRRRASTPRYRGRAEFLFVRLTNTDFLFAPAHGVACQPAYFNSFAALRPATAGDETPLDIPAEPPGIIPSRQA